MIKFLDLKKQYDRISAEIDEAIRTVISESAFIGGRHVEEFQHNFADYQHTKHCVGVANGTDAIEIAIEALELDSESEIIVPANSFISSAEAVTRSGHKVVFCDCHPQDYTISIKDVENRITEKTAAIIAVHLFGHPCDMDSLKKLARNTKIRIIEDCAQAHGAEYKGKRVGAIGDIGTFSFYPGKNLGAYGDGGAIVTNDPDLATKCRMIANHGRIAKYNHEFEGRNSRLDGLQAAILNVKLKHLDEWIVHRIRIAELYYQTLESCSDGTCPVTREWSKHVYHLWVFRTGRRDELRSYLNDKGIQTGIHYPIALPKLAAYQYLSQDREPMYANSYDSQLLSLPIGEHLSLTDAKYVSESVKACLCN